MVDLKTIRNKTKYIVNIIKNDELALMLFFIFSFFIIMPVSQCTALPKTPKDYIVNEEFIPVYVESYEEYNVMLDSEYVLVLGNGTVVITDKSIVGLYPGSQVFITNKKINNGFKSLLCGLKFYETCVSISYVENPVNDFNTKSQGFVIGSK